MTRPSTSSLLRRRHQERCEDTMQQGWSDLPEGPLHTILTCLRSLVDFISFSSVCRSWRAVASQNASLFPPLLLRPTFNGSRRISSLCLLDPASPSFSSTLSRTSNRFKSVGFNDYSHGHLLRLSRKRVVIFNPFTGDELCSPPITTDHRKISSSSIQLTSPLSSPDSGILLCASSCLFYWRISSPSWSCHCCPRLSPNGELTVVTMQGKVYAMDAFDTIYGLDLSPNLHLTPLAVEGFELFGRSLWRSLVECGGELLRLQFVNVEGTMSAQLEALQLDLSENNKMRWVKKETLGNWAIFLGCDRVPGIAFENPERWGGQSNCAYFATRDASGYSPWVVIKLGDGFDLSDIESPLFHVNFGNRILSWVRPGF